MPDLRIAIRSLLQSPVVSLAAVLSLALGIGANTALFSIVNQILLRVLPVPDPGELVYLYHPGRVQGSSSSNEPGAPFSHPMFRDLQKALPPNVRGIAATRPFGASLAYQGKPLPGDGLLVSGNFFQLLGVTPLLGRLLSEDDDRTPGAHAAAVLGHRYWQNQLGSNPAVLNEKLLVNGYPMTIVGVAPPGFQSERFGFAPEVYVPLMMKAQMTPNWDALNDRKSYWLSLFARLKPGVTLPQAETALNVPYHAMLPGELKLITGWTRQQQQQFLHKRIVLEPGEFGRGGQRAQARTPLLILMGMTAAVVLIACANIANLLLARGAARTREIAVRLAMGAGRGQIARLLLLEALVLAAAGGGLALLAARWTLDVIIASVDEGDLLNAQLTPAVMFYCGGLTILSALLSGGFPAWKASRLELAGMLKHQSSQASASGGNLRRLLVAGQASMSLMLVVVSGLFARSLLNVVRIDSGLEASRVVMFYLNPGLNRYDRARTAAFYSELEQKIGGIPGVVSVTASSVAFLTGDNWSTSVTVPGYRAPDDDQAPSYAEVGSRFLSTMGIPLLAGREFADSDAAETPKVAIVNEAFAYKYYGGLDVAGRQFGLGLGNVPMDITVVGLARNSGYSEITESPRPVFYLPYRQQRALNGHFFYVRTHSEGAAIAPQIRRAVAALDPDMPIRDLRPMAASLRESTENRRMLTALSATFAGLATLLAAIGLYGVLAYSVARRTREIGIRVAFGAMPADIRRMVTKEAAWMFGVGAAVGLPLALAVGRLARSQLYGVTAQDPVVIAISAALLAAIALAAALIPARRASGVEPVKALRYE